MAEQQARNALTPGTQPEETSTAAEQIQPTDEPTRHGEAGARNDANGTHSGTTPEKTRARKKTVDSAVSAAAGEAAVPTRRRATTRKSAPPKKRRKTAQPVKKEEASPQETQEGAVTETATAPSTTSTQADATVVTTENARFEPELDPTPVKARETPPRSLASIEAELDALRSEPVPEEPPSRIEDTTALPALHDIPETPMIPSLEAAKAPETPLPAVDEEDALEEPSVPAVDEKAWDAPVTEKDVAATRSAARETQRVVEPGQIARPVVVVRPQARPRPRRRSRLLKRVAMLVAFLICLASSLLLWQNVNETHLYLYAIDPGSGQMLTRQDLGGYASVGALSNPAQDSSSLFVSVSSSPAAQQVLALAGSATSWNVTRQFAAAPGRATLSVGPGHALAVEDGNGLQVLASDGRVLWRVAGDVPLLGAHPFTPAFDASTIYTITSAKRGVVGAYDARSGSPRWHAQLDDTLNYAPPMLLAGDTLFVAGDSTLYALNTVTGGTYWKVAMPARALLYSQGRTPALIAAGPSGLAALDPRTGNLLWAFNGQPDTNNASSEADTLSPAQFYQASLSRADNMIYATGVVWDTQQLLQQLWLFAVDASSGKVTWSEPIGTGFTGADAGRVFAPFIDTAHKLIEIEQAQSDGGATVSAFDMGDGLPRWSARFAAVAASSPALAQLPGGNLGVFSAQDDAGLVLHSASGSRSLLFVLAIASFLALLSLWLFPLRTWLSNTGRRLRRLPYTLLAPLRAVGHLWRFSRLLFAITLIAVLIGAGLLTYTQLNQPQSYVRQVEGSNGNAMWQHVAAPATTLAGTGSSGALVVTGAADHTFALNALAGNGSLRWTLPSGEGTFSLPNVATQAGTTLAVLHGPATLPYRYAASDPAYPNPLAHYFALYLLDSSTGAVLWRAIPGKTGALADFSVLGADAQFIYLAGRSGQSQVAQLLAVDKMDGTIAWRFYGPEEQADSAPDLGAILARGNLVYWQVDSAVYALNPQTGQVEWRDAIPEVDAQVAPLEDGQMATGAGILLIRRSDMYHALDPATGVERWTLSGLGVDNPHMPGGILADGNKFILYGGGSIEAYDPATQNVLWQHDNLAAISNVSLSPDGSTVYAVVFNNAEGGATTQALVAFDANSDLIRWTFQPGAQAQFVYAGARIIYNASGMIYLATCVTNGSGPCTRQVLYGIDEQTGKARWQIAATRISALQASQNGQTLTFQITSSAWEHLKALFHG